MQLSEAWYGWMARLTRSRNGTVCLIVVADAMCARAAAYALVIGTAVNRCRHTVSGT